MINFKSHRTWLLISYLMLMILNSLFSFISSNYIWRYDKIVHFSEYFTVITRMHSMMVMKIMVNKFMNYGMYFYYNLVSVMYYDRSAPIVGRNSTSFTIKDDVSLGHIFSWIPKCTTTNTFSSKPIHSGSP